MALAVVEAFVDEILAESLGVGQSEEVAVVVSDLRRGDYVSETIGLSLMRVTLHWYYYLASLISSLFLAENLRTLAAADDATPRARWVR